MKPLELIIYPKDEAGYYRQPTTGNAKQDEYGADLHAHYKHFTSAELSAEYWHAVAQYETTRWPVRRLIQLEAEYLTMGRFATTPSYDE